MTVDEVWRLVVDNERLLKREVKRMLPRDRRHEFEELYSDVVIERAVSIMATYRDGMGAKPITHLCTAVRWYAMKWVRHRRRNEFRDSLVEPRELAKSDYEMPECTLAQRLVVDSILDKIPEEAAQLLRWHFAMGFDYKEIASHYTEESGVTARDIRAMIHDAIELARDYAGLAL